jgi:hypothetical protein
MSLHRGDQGGCTNWRFQYIVVWGLKKLSSLCNARKPQIPVQLSGKVRSFSIFPPPLHSHATWFPLATNYITTSFKKIYYIMKCSLRKNSVGLQKLITRKLVCWKSFCDDYCIWTCTFNCQVIFSVYIEPKGLLISKCFSGKVLVYLPVRKALK